MDNAASPGLWKTLKEWCQTKGQTPAPFLLLRVGVYAMDGVYDKNAGAIFVLTGIFGHPALTLRAS